MTDDAPALRATLLQPNKPDGTQGDPWPLFGGSCTIVIAPKDRSAPAFTGACTIVDNGTGDETAGVVDFPWTGFDTSIAKDYDFRFKGVTGAGQRFSVPNDVRAPWLTLSVTPDPG